MFAVPQQNDRPSGDRESVNFEDLLQKLDSEVAALPSGFIKSFKFELNGIRFDIRRIEHENGFRFLVTAIVGYLPFSIESVERRDAIKTIVAAAKSLPTVHFTMDHASKITAGGLFEIPANLEPSFFFYPLTLFLQEARPFMDLIGQYLYATPARA
jgi:hypothetical protein